MDYGSLDTSLMFSRCDRRRCANIAITSDDVLEKVELFNVLERNGLDERIMLDPTQGQIAIIYR